jgi:hypothetical protein
MQMSMEQLANDIERIYSSEPSQAETLIEGYLESRLNALSAHERLTSLKDLAAHFEPSDSGSMGKENVDDEMLSRIFSAFLGRQTSLADLSSTERLHRLAESLNTIFDELNQLVGAINMTLFGEGAGDETIRHLIGFHLEGGGEGKSLESYLGQIRKAFLIAQQSYKKATHALVGQILDELDPARIERAESGGFRFGPLRRAEFYDTYKEKFQRCKKWFESDRFMEELLREFEKNCHKLSSQ